MPGLPDMRTLRNAQDVLGGAVFAVHAVRACPSGRLQTPADTVPPGAKAMSDVEKICAGLTEAQRRAILSGDEPTGGGKWPVRNALQGRGLALSWPWRLTPLGLQVRAHLLGEVNNAR